MEEQYLDDEDIQSLRDQLEEQNFKTNGEDYEDFMSGPIWEDLKAMLEERIESNLIRLEDMGNTAQMDIIYKARLHELRQFIKYPEHVIELFKVTKKEEPDESTKLAA